MRIVSLGQQKGGVGKSAAAINLACQAIAAGAKAAVIDMDAEQGTSSKWGKRRAGKDAPIVTAANAVTLIPLLNDLRSQDVDWAFLDLPGRNAPIASAGLVASNLILIPVRPLDVDVEASVQTLQAAKRAKKAYAYVLNISPPQLDKKRARYFADTLKGMGHPVAPVIIVQRLIVPDSIAKGESADEADPKGESAAEFKALFDWLNKEIGS